MQTGFLFLSLCLGLDFFFPFSILKIISKEEKIMNKNLNQIVLGGGCFWCLEPIFSKLRGVENVVVGYAGGSTPHPSYEQVCTGKTGHAEVIQIAYDKEQISLDELLDVFFQVHDPTTLDRQGADVGTQYRSIILVNNENERELALEKIKQLNQTNAWKNPVVTQVELLQEFFQAEEYHQNYYEKNPWAGYCQVVIKPKVKKFTEKYKKDLMK